MADNYQKLYDKSRELFLSFDQEDMIRVFGLEHDDRYLYLSILGERAAIDRKTGVITCGGTPVSFNAACPVYDILSRAKDSPKLSGSWVSITQLGGNTASYHVDTLHPQVQKLFGKCSQLKALCRSWGGVEQRQGDVSFIVPLYDFFPLWVQFWDGDDEFPPQFRCLWDANTLQFMYYETTWYAHGLILDRMLREAKK